jgi:hypothetical protein
MSDDTQQPFSPGYCASEPFPINAADRMAALQRQIDVLWEQIADRDKAYASRVDDLSGQLMRCRDALDACRQRLRSLPNGDDLIAVVDQIIGPDRLLQFVEQRTTGRAAPIQGAD